VHGPASPASLPCPASLASLPCPASPPSLPCPASPACADEPDDDAWPVESPDDARDVDDADELEPVDALEELDEDDSLPASPPLEDELHAPVALARRTIIVSTVVLPGACGTFGTFLDFDEASDADGFMFVLLSR
jgi:hypothetical protein